MFDPGARMMRAGRLSVGGRVGRERTCVTAAWVVAAMAVTLRDHKAPRPKAPFLRSAAMARSCNHVWLQSTAEIKTRPNLSAR